MSAVQEADMNLACRRAENRTDKATDEAVGRCAVWRVRCACSSDVPGGVSMIRKSRGPQITSSMNCLIIAFFLGPRQTTASSVLLSKKAIDITERRCEESAYTGTHPSLDCMTCVESQQNPDANVFKPGSNRSKTEADTCRPSNPRTFAALGPQRSTSRRPTLSPEAVNVCAS